MLNDSVYGKFECKGNTFALTWPGVAVENETIGPVIIQPGMDSAWSGRGGVLCQLWCRVASVDVRRPPINLPDCCIWIVVHSSFVNMLLLKLLYFILLYYMEDTTPSARAGGTHPQ
jgi:hypothetical protein